MKISMLYIKFAMNLSPRSFPLLEMSTLARSRALLAAIPLVAELQASL